MTTRLAVDVIASYLETINIHDDLNATFVFGDNLYIGNLLGFAAGEEALSLNMYPGEPPRDEKQSCGVQMIFKSSSGQKARAVIQALINDLHESSINSQGHMKAINSAPQMLWDQEGGEFKLAEANFLFKHVKIT